MKELKWKREEQKKIIVENLVKNTKEKVVLPVKKVEAAVEWIVSYFILYLYAKSKFYLVMILYVYTILF